VETRGYSNLPNWLNAKGFLNCPAGLRVTTLIDVSKHPWTTLHPPICSSCRLRTCLEDLGAAVTVVLMQLYFLVCCADRLHCSSFGYLHSSENFICKAFSPDIYLCSGKLNHCCNAKQAVGLHCV